MSEHTPLTEAEREVERLCEVMHDAYEAAAVEAGWETQQRSRVPWADVPKANKATMRVAVRALLAARTSTATADTDESWRREVCRDDPCSPGRCPATNPTCAGRRPRAATADTGLRERVESKAERDLPGIVAARDRWAMRAALAEGEVGAWRRWATTWLADYRDEQPTKRMNDLRAALDATPASTEDEGLRARVIAALDAVDDQDGLEGVWEALDAAPAQDEEVGR